jgi:hypothetical protein
MTEDSNKNAYQQQILNAFGRDIERHEGDIRDLEDESTEQNKNIALIDFRLKSVEDWKACMSAKMTPDAYGSIGTDVREMKSDIDTFKRTSKLFHTAIAILLAIISAGVITVRCGIT